MLDLEGALAVRESSKTAERCQRAVNSRATLGRTHAALPYQDPARPVATRVHDLLARMSLTDKVGQMTQISLQDLVGTCQGTFGPPQPNPECLRAHLRDERVGSVLSGGGQAPVPNTPRAWAELTNALTGTKSAKKALDDATSLDNGVLILTPLKGVDGVEYVVPALGLSAAALASTPLAPEYAAREQAAPTQMSVVHEYIFPGSVPSATREYIWSSALPPSFTCLSSVHPAGAVTTGSALPR